MNSEYKLHREWQARPLHDHRSYELFLVHKLEAAKLREREEKGRADGHWDALKIARKNSETLSRERDAALSALKEISEADTWLTQRNNEAVSPWVIEVAKKALSGNPSAALAERDRAIEKRTAERCAEIAHSMYHAGWCREKILREFNLGTKQKHPVTTD